MTEEQTGYLTSRGPDMEGRNPAPTGPSGWCSSRRPTRTRAAVHSARLVPRSGAWAGAENGPGVWVTDARGIYEHMVLRQTKRPASATGCRTAKLRTIAEQPLHASVLKRGGQDD